MVSEIKAYIGWDRSGKSLCQAKDGTELILSGEKKHCYGNVDLFKVPREKITVMGNLALRAWLAEMVENDIRDSVILIDEMERVLPPRLWKDKKQIEAVEQLWQAAKQGLSIIWVGHRSRPADIVLRSATHIWRVIEKQFKPVLDVVKWTEYDMRYSNDGKSGRLRQCHLYFDWFDTGQSIKR